ncbi:DNA polymerase III subunit delta' [Oceanobacillus locisalsi]|uniref:DNA polymerase III subunit delta n=1 Tax=Oceanobacillus locisalsi TaxID=546107 RepID=A0ABW3NGZ9_9BACI
MQIWEDIEKIQPVATRTLVNSIKKNRISHAYLFQGDRGTGKQEMALLLAKYLFCQNQQGANPCNNCINCQRIDSGNHPDMHWIEPDGASIKIEQVRNLQKEFTYSGMESSRKVYIIKDADTLTVNAANRLLKFLEEPNVETTAMMLTENGHAILSTIRSRCQIIDLQPLPPGVLQERLQQEDMSETDAKLLSTLTNSMTEALELAQDDWFAGARKIVIQWVEMYTTQPEDIYTFVHQNWIPHFKDREGQERGLDLLILGFKDILNQHIYTDANTILLSNDPSKSEKRLITFSQSQLLTILHQILMAKRKLKANVQPTLVIEQLALQIQR